MALIALAVLAATRMGPGWPVLARPARLPLLLAGLVFAAWLPSLPGSLNVAVSAGTMARVALLVAGGVLLWSFLTARPELTRSLNKVFLVGMIAAGLFVLAASTVAPALVAFRTHGTPNPALQFKASASVFACAFPVVIYAGWRLGGRWRAAALVAVVLGLFAIQATHSRSGLAGLLIAIGVALLLLAGHRFGRRIGAALWAAAIAIPTAALGWMVSRPLEIWHGPYAERVPAWVIDPHRQVIWQFVFDQFLERPWFGWGINTINESPGAHEGIPGLGAEFVPSHPHSWLLQILSETGVIGFLPTLAVVVGVGVVAALAWNRHPTPQRLAWLLLWCAFWMSSAFNFSFWAAWWQTAAVLLAVLVLAPDGEAE
ncbi:MAG: O-antigen ligase family protein [Magnetospirillum sp.]|nr:O-antigen ligase family protein [Magnetospirillum sp.]